MPSVYLQPSEYATYSSGALTPLLVQQASALVDGYLGRPEGVMWVADGVGNPCYMAAMDPTLAFQLGGPIAPGLNVSVQLPPNMLGISNDSVGEVVIIDRATPASTEACVIASIAGAASTGWIVMFEQVINAHPAGAPIEFGLVITEECELPARRSIARVAKWPVVRLVSAQGRYGYGRRQQQQTGILEEMSILVMQGVFGGPPAWQPIDTSAVSINPKTGEVWVPAGLSIAYYTEVRLSFVAGWKTIPAQIKTATANIATVLANIHPVMLANVKSFAAGGTKIERFAAGIIDENTTNLLRSFKARTFV